MSASVVGKRVLHVKHGRSASSRASLRGESLLRGEVQLCCERIEGFRTSPVARVDRAAAARSIAAEFDVLNPLGGA